MPDLSSIQTALRADGHQVEGWIGFWLGSVVWTFTITSTPTYPAKSITGTTAGGSYTAARPGFRVVIETAGGAFVGETSIRFSGSNSATTMHIRELSNAEIPIASGMVAKVYNVPILTDLLPEDTSAFKPDGASAPGGTVHPIAVTGGHYMGKLPTGVTSVDVDFDADSYVRDEDSSTVSHSWSAPTATGTTSSSSATPTFTFTAGYHLVEYTATDDDNSATTTAYACVQVYDDSNPPWECIVSGIEGTVENGWSAGGVEVFENVGITDVPDRAMGCLFVRERINGTQASYGNRLASRSHMKHVGFLSRDSSAGDADNDTLKFDLISPLQRLAEIAAFSKILINDSTPTAWSDVEGLTMLGAALWIARYYSNVTQLFDWLYDVVTDRAYSRLDVQKDDFMSQLRDLLDGIDADVRCDRTGRFIIGTRQEFIALADRADLTTTITLTDDDIIEYEAIRDHFDVVETVQAAGISAGTSGNASYWARYPGTPGRGNVVQEFARKIFSASAPQTDANNRVGLYGAWVNNVFIDGDSINRRGVDLTLTLFGAYDVFDMAYQEWVKFDYTLPRREIDLNDFRFILRGVSVDYADGTATTTLELRSETAAPAGRTHTQPDSASLGDYTTSDLDFGLAQPIGVPTLPYPVPATGGPIGVKRVLVLGHGEADIALATAADIEVSYTDISSGFSGIPYWASVNPNNFNEFYVCGSNGIYKKDIFDTGQTWTQVLNDGYINATNGLYHFITASPYKLGWFIALAGETEYVTTDDYGANWTNYTGTEPAAQSQYRSNCYAGWHNNSTGRVFLTLRNNGAINLYRSSDWMQNYSLIDQIAGAYQFSGICTVPFARHDGSANTPDTSQIVMGNGSHLGTIWTSTDGGATMTAKEGTNSGVTSIWYGVNAPSMQTMQPSWVDGWDVFTIRRQLSTGQFRVMRTLDLFGSSSALTNQPGIPDSYDIATYQIGIVRHPSQNDWLMLWGNNLLKVTTDGGASAWIDALANLSTLWGHTRINWASPV